MKKKTFSYAKYGYLFSIPFILVYLIFSLYPTIYTAIIGFTDLKGIGNTTINFLSEDLLENFKKILTNPTFLTSLKNTFGMWIANFIPQITLALLLAAWYTSRRYKIKGQGFFKVIFYLPNIITAATVAILFKAFFDYPMSPVNDIVTTLKLAADPVQFLQSKMWARGIIVFIQFWMWYGYTMIILMSGILGISPDIFEAAEIDGANNRQTFFMITLPSIRTILTYTLITSLIGGLNMFDIPNLFLAGGPNNATVTASVFIYQQAFSGSYLYNRAAAASMIMFIIIAILSAIVFFMMRDKDEEELRKLIKKQEKEYKAKMKAARKEAK